MYVSQLPTTSRNVFGVEELLLKKKKANKQAGKQEGSKKSRKKVITTSHADRERRDSHSLTATAVLRLDLAQLRELFVPEDTH